MPSIKVKNISFGDPPFRKLGGMTIEFANRMTVIAGHNGIGKSTIMALVANNSGLTRRDKHTSLFGRTFQANLFEIAHVDYFREYLDPKAQDRELPEPLVEYLVNDTDRLVKACSMTGRAQLRKARVVSRNAPHADFVSGDLSISVGKDAKVPLPTIYLGMIRMFPVGEANPNWVQPTHDKSVAAEEAKFISDFVNEVVPGSKARSDHMTSLGIRGTKKLAKQPNYGHDARCISLGQDSLGNIATALASFQRLKREWPEYPGGLLVIDEVDAGLHPHAQAKLVKSLKSAAKKLDLQIIATTHSAHIVEAVHPEGAGDARAPDAVVYMKDTRAPSVAVDYSLQEILDDMSLKLPQPPARPERKALKLYLEDAEALFVFNAVVGLGLKRSLAAKYGVALRPIALGVGCDSLVGLSGRDKDFEKALMVVDADASVPKHAANRGNVLKLPGAVDAAGKGMNPERTLHQWIDAIVANPNHHPNVMRALSDKRLTTDHLHENLLEGNWSMANRDAAKTWWRNKRSLIRQYKLFELWASVHDNEVQQFCQQLDAAVGLVAGRLK